MLLEIQVSSEVPGTAHTSYSILDDQSTARIPVINQITITNARLHRIEFGTRPISGFINSARRTRPAKPISRLQTLKTKFDNKI